MEGQEKIAASVGRVWDALNDPVILQQCIPGCQDLQKKSDNAMAATVVVKMGPIKATFVGEVELLNINAPHSYSIVGAGKGGGAGFAKGGADVALMEDGHDGCILSYSARTEIGGKIAQLGSRLIESTSKKLTAEFFSTFNRKVSG